jgi:PAP2 superfamily
MVRNQLAVAGAVFALVVGAHAADVDAPRTAAGNGATSKDTGQVLLPTVPAGMLVHRQPGADFQPTAAYQWVEILLEASGRDAVRNKPRPTVLSRTDAIVLTAMYDAWAAYDAKAVGTRLGGKLRRPKSERTVANKEKAIAYAAYRALLFVYPEDKEWIRGELQKKGFDPDDGSTELRTPQGVGNTAASAVIEYRRNDGANQLGDEPGGNGKPYSDYTGYAPVNTPEKVVDKLRWMPIPFSDGKGGTVSPGFLTAQWGKVRPFALESADQFRPPMPPGWGSETLKRDIEEAVRVNADLTIEQKAIVEFMREGPRSTGQSGHWLQFAEDVSRRDHNDLDRDVKMFFSVGNVVMDAFVACWEAKRYYDPNRPYWWARFQYEGKQIEGWAGPGKGTAQMPAEQWRPYSPAEFVTPPFPGYVSGHATASGAGSRILELFTGSDRYGAVAFQEAGAVTGEADVAAAQMQARSGTPAKDVPDSKVVRIDLPTFTRTSETAAMSRLWGGYHIRTDNEEGLVLGRRIAMYSWPKYQAYFDGTAKQPAAAIAHTAELTK